MVSRKIIFRADGNSEIGLGHVIRSLAMAEMLKGEFECIFATRYLNDFIRKEVKKSCNSLIELPKDEHYDYFLNNLEGKEIVVLDNYFFTTNYQMQIKNKGCTLVCVDDIHSQHFVADAVINHAPGLSDSAYSVEEYTKLFLGPKYSLVRGVYRVEDSVLKIDSHGNKESLFLCFGGADFNNVTGKVLDLLEKYHVVDAINVVIGGANKHLEVIKKQVNGMRLPVDVYVNLNANEMVKVLRNSTMAIVPSSTILYEVLSTGIPAISGYFVDNQINIYKGFLCEGLILGCDNFESEELIIDNLNRIKKNKGMFIKRQREVFNGQSNKMILELFKELI